MLLQKCLGFAAKMPAPQESEECIRWLLAHFVRPGDRLHLTHIVACCPCGGVALPPTPGSQREMVGAGSG